MKTTPENTGQNLNQKLQYCQKVRLRKKLKDGAINKKIGRVVEPDDIPMEFWKCPEVTDLVLLTKLIKYRYEKNVI